jgi:hydrogenase maturation protein HypF
LSQMIARGINSPLTSSLGRLFDAVAALLGLPLGAATQLYEGQAAIELEIQAKQKPQLESYPYSIETGSEQTPALLDVAPIIRAIVGDMQQGVSVPQIANRFHRSIAALLANVCEETRKQTGLNIVALSGGVFQNRLLLEQLLTLLENMAFSVYINRRVPPNDGGLCLGQIAIAAAQLRAT